MDEQDVQQHIELSRLGVLILSDLHLGSLKAMLMPGFVGADEVTHIPTPEQAWLWKKFLAILDHVADSKESVDEIVLNGDLLEGLNPSGRGRGLILHSIEDQCLAMKRVLSELTNRWPKVKMTFIFGTPYHELPADVRMIMQGIVTPNNSTDIYRFDYHGTRCLFKHQLSTASSNLTLLAKDAMAVCGANQQWGWERPHLYVGSHVHNKQYGDGGVDDFKVIITPCFKLPDEFAKLRSPDKWTVPSLGATYLSIAGDSAVKEIGGERIIHKFLSFRAPAPTWTKVTK